jgi:ankyrin repeat protein/CRP-like cAMP-binding protein
MNSGFCADRWGNTPLDDAYRGGTTYHKYCGRLIYAWGGTLGKALENTNSGRAFMAEIDQIAMEDVRRLIRRLIEAGYDRRVPTSSSDQQVHTYYETSVKNIVLAHDLKTEVYGGAEYLKAGTHHIHSLFETMQDCLMPICISIDLHPVNQSRRMSDTVSLDSSIIYQKSDASGNSVTASSIVRNNSLESELRSLVMRNQRQDVSENADDTEDAPQPLDSDEEAQLHAELDTLLEMQERVEAMGGNQNKYMASVFQRACLQITDIEGMFMDLSNVFCRASVSNDTNSTPSVTLKEFSVVLDALNLSSISQSDLEEMFEQGLRHVPFKTDIVGSTTKSMTDQDDLMVSETLKTTDVGDESQDDNVKVSLTSLLIGSDIFRSRIMSVVTDEAFCYLKEASALQHLSDAQLRSLSAGGRLRTVAKGEIFCCETDVNSRSKPKYSANNSIGGVNGRGVTARAQRVRPMSEHMNQASNASDSVGASEVAAPSDDVAANVAAGIHKQYVARFPQGGDGLQSPIAKAGRQVDHSTFSWFFIVSGSLFVEDDPLQFEQKLYSELGQGNIFGGYKALTDTRTPFIVKATKGCQLLELPRDNLLAFRNEAPDELVKRIASHMGEAPLSASMSVGSELGNATLMPADQENRVSHDLVDGSLAETRLQAIKMAFSKLEQVWQEICLGEQIVPLSQFLAFQPYLGEVGSELFKKLFLAQEIPEHISKAVYWEIWINFLSIETYGKKVIDLLDKEDQVSAENPDPTIIDSDVHEEQVPNCFEMLHARFSTSRHLKHSFFNDDVVERYEQSFVAITGDIGASLHTSQIKNFLERLFPDFHHQISVHNSQEFLQAFGRDGNKTKQIAFADIRKVLMERSKESSTHGLFIDNALNPNSRAYARWSIVVSAVACLHYICVPVRLSLKPWDSMTDYRALALDLTVDMLTFVHVIVLSNTAYKNARGHWVANRLKIVRRINVFCLIAAIPADWFAYVFGASYEMCNWLRLLKLSLPYEVFVRQVTQVARRSTYQRMFKLSSVMLALLHMAACMWFYIGTRYKQWYPEDAVTWNEINPSLESMTRVSYHDRYGLKKSATVWDQYLISLYWATVTLTSYGIVGDLLPQNNVEIIYAMCLMVLNITVFAFIIGEVSTVFMIQDEEVTKARAQLGAVESFVRGSQLEDDLRDEIKLHFKATRMHSSSDQAAIFRRMSRSLQIEVSSYTTRGYLDGVPLFQGCSPQLIDAISVLLSEVTFSPEDYLYRISEIAREMFFVIDGTVEEVTESDKGEKVEAVVKAGGSIGVLSFFFGMRHLGSARAGKLAGAICLRLSRDEFMDMLKLYPEEEGRIAQSAMKSFEGARSQYGSRRASSHAPSTRTGGSNAVSSGNGKSSSDGDRGGHDDDIDSSEAFTQALGGSGIRQRMAALKRRRENKRVYGVLTAAANGDLGRLKASITGEGDCNISDHFRRTPLHVAAAQGQLDSVRILLAARADADARDRFENTPLNDAVRHHHDDVAELIRERTAGAAISLKGHVIGGLICQAAFEGDLEHVRRLITNRASPSACDYDRRSALHLACCEGHAEIVRFLLEVGADPLARDRFGGAPLDDAVRHGHTHLQAMLCKSGARLTGEKYAFKMCEAAARGDLDAIRTLVENGVDTAVGDYDGRTALHLAASEGEVSILHYLLEQEPPLDVNCVDRVGGTPLEDAVRHGHRVAVMMLEDSGGMRRHEKRLSELVGRYLAHLDPNRIDVLLRSRRGAAAMRLKLLRADGVRLATDEGVEAKALESIRDGILPTIRTRIQMLQDVFELLVANILAASPVILSALHMNGASIAADNPASSTFSIAKILSMGNSQATEFKSAAFSGSAGRDPTAGGYAVLRPMEATVALLAKLPELSAAVVALREAIEAPLPRCRVVQMCARAFRREAAALRVEVRRTGDASRLLRRILRGAQTVFRTRTFRNILRRAMSFSSVCRNLSSDKPPLTPPLIRKVGSFLKAKAAITEAGEQAGRARALASDLMDPQSHHNRDTGTKVNSIVEDEPADPAPPGGLIKLGAAKRGGMARSAQALPRGVTLNAAANRPRPAIRFAAETVAPAATTRVAQRAAVVAISSAPRASPQAALQQRHPAPPLLDRQAATPQQLHSQLEEEEEGSADEEAVMEPAESQLVGQERRGGGWVRRPGRGGRGGGVIAMRSSA